MAWMRMMGAESVEYHRDTVMERADDQPGSALAYYASLGETPMRWGGSGAAALGLEGIVTDAQYSAFYGPGGASHPVTGERLVASQRPGMELVIAAHKSVAELGVIGRAADMHAIMDAERDATLAYLDDVARRIGGRRGRAAIPTATSGLVFAVTRHATSRAGDPGPHDHVLLANVVEMLDAKGGFKGADMMQWQDHLHAATIIGRWHAAVKARELGYAVVADRGPSDRLGHWAIAGVPEAVMENHSKRAAEIEAECEAKGSGSYQARQVAARATRKAKGHLAPEDLMGRWTAENEALGWGVDALTAAVEAAGADPALAPEPLDPAAVAAGLLAPAGRLSERKIFTRLDVIVAVGATHPESYGRPVDDLYRAVERVLADPEAVALIGSPHCGERAHSTASIVANEQAVAAAVAAQVDRSGVARVEPGRVAAAVADKQAQLGGPLTAGQVAAVTGICASGRGVDLVEGVAGAGKTTVMAVARAAFEAAGCTVIGTATSGQAARTLAREAGIDESRTVASLRWRLEHGTLQLDSKTVVIHDEAGMTDDADVAVVLQAAGLAGAKVVMVGDDRQLSSIGSGGALGALIERHGGTVYRLEENVRQHDPGERQALAQLRAGHVAAAVDWYQANGRVVIEWHHSDVLDLVVDGWAADALGGKDAAMFAYRRKNVAELNARARLRWEAAGRLGGPELQAPGGASYRAGDRVVTLASGAGGRIVTSERGTVAAVDSAVGALRVRMDDGRLVDLAGQDLAADRLAHGYAITVHRSQGATVQVTHALEDGGGRELAYVRMSRARESTTLYLVAESPEQAGEDLRRAWSNERRWRWAIDTALPEAGVSGPVPPALRRAQLLAQRDAVTAAVPAEQTANIVASAERINTARRHLDDLQGGRGDYADTPAGDAARDLAEAKQHREEARRMSQSSELPRRDRRAWADNQTRWAQTQADAQDRWDRHGAPEHSRLTQDLHDATDRHSAVLEAHDARRVWLSRHPELPRLLGRIDRELDQLDQDLADRRRHLDGIDTTTPAPGRAVGDTQAGWSWARQPHRDNDIGL
jgi:conjugative relaxase-like TrwC/TraI family protein